MREIKFRAWHPTSGMAYTPIIQRSDYTGIVKCEGFTKDGDLIFLELMQFTGLQDKDGKDIYEGDILCTTMRHNEIKGVMEWDSESSAWSRFRPLDRFIVIGNIYENPELLK